MKLRNRFRRRAALLTFSPMLAFAQSSDIGDNLANCKAGRESCHSSKLTPAESVEVALAAHARNVATCRTGYGACDRSKLSESEVTALAVADHQRNVTDCNQGTHSCDTSKLTALEAHDSSVAEENATSPTARTD